MNTELKKSYLLLLFVIASVPAYSETSTSAGEIHTCLLNSSGQAYCWGENSVGQLGDGSTKSSMVPVAVSGDLRFKSISVGWDHTCGVTNHNSLFKGFFELAEFETEKSKFIYVVGTTLPLKFLKGGRALASVLSRFPAISNRITSKYGDGVTRVRDYYRLKEDEVEIVDVSPYIGRDV